MLVLTKPCAYAGVKREADHALLARITELVTQFVGSALLIFDKVIVCEYWYSQVVRRS